MTRRERFSAFLANKPVDRVPVALFHHFCNASDFNRGLVDPDAFERNVEGHRKAREVFDPDVAKVMNDTLMLYPLDMSFVEKPSDLKKIQPPAMDSKFVQKTLELTKRVREIYSDSDAPLYGTSFSPYTIFRFALSPNGLLGNGGDEATFRRFMEEDPESVSEGLRILGEQIAELNRRLITECGVDGIYLSVNNQSKIISEEAHKAYVAPHEKAIIASANKWSKINLLHICGGPIGLPSTLELYRDYDVAACNWAIEAEGVSLGEGKKILNGKPVFGGFPRAGFLEVASREEIKAKVFELLNECGQTGVMLGDDCTVSTTIDDNRLEWVRQAAIEYAEKH